MPDRRIPHRYPKAKEDDFRTRGHRGPQGPRRSGRDGKRRTSRRKFFPGYVLVELETPVTDETLQMIKETPKVTGFVGGGAQPTPLTNEEVAELLKQVDAGSAGPREQVKFIKTDNVRIVDGPFLGFNGIVDEVDQDHNRLKVMVSIFGRSTPVELGFLQVERI